MDLSQRPAVVANLTKSANAPGADTSAPTPATPTTATEATGRGGNHTRYTNREFLHRGFVMVEVEEDDGDGFATPAYMAWRPSIDPLKIRGERLFLSHPRFDFTPTQEWFEGEVDRHLAEQSARDRRNALAIGRDAIANLLVLGTFCATAWFVAVIA